MKGNGEDAETHSKGINKDSQTDSHNVGIEKTWMFWKQGDLISFLQKSVVIAAGQVWLFPKYKLVGLGL